LALEDLGYEIAPSFREELTEISCARWLSHTIPSREMDVRR